MTNFPKGYSSDIFGSFNAATTGAAMRRRYPVSKLLGVLLTRELAARLKPADLDDHSPPSVIVNCTNPGFCHSNLGDDGPRLGRVLRIVLSLVLTRKTEVGSRTLVSTMAASDDTRRKYLSNCHIAE